MSMDIDLHLHPCLDLFGVYTRTICISSTALDLILDTHRDHVDRDQFIVRVSFDCTTTVIGENGIPRITASTPDVYRSRRCPSSDCVRPEQWPPISLSILVSSCLASTWCAITYDP
jgi:hypothetical protein